MDNPNIIPHKHSINIQDRIDKLGYKPQTLWFTGLSGSGKSTLANELEKHLFENGYNTYILDGDNVRKGLNSDLSFSESDRVENIRRISHVSSLLIDAGVFVLTAFISPFLEDREKAKSIIGKNSIVEIFVDTPLEECEKRDVKGLYKKARNGQIKDFTGLDSPFEAPETPDIHIETKGKSIDESVKELIHALQSKEIIKKLSINP